jgi:hypothetical protein
MSSGFPTYVIRCPICQARSATLTGPIRSDAVVACSQCGTPLCTWAEFLERLAATIVPAVPERRGTRALRKRRAGGRR